MLYCVCMSPLSQGGPSRGNEYLRCIYVVPLMIKMVVGRYLVVTISCNAPVPQDDKVREVPSMIKQVGVCQRWCPVWEWFLSGRLYLEIYVGSSSCYVPFWEKIRCWCCLTRSIRKLNPVLEFVGFFFTLLFFFFYKELSVPRAGLWILSPGGCSGPGFLAKGRTQWSLQTFFSRTTFARHCLGFIY